MIVNVKSVYLVPISYENKDRIDWINLSQVNRIITSGEGEEICVRLFFDNQKVVILKDSQGEQMIAELVKLNQREKNHD